MPMFDYVMVLASIVIGLALTHLMQGVAGLIQQPRKVRIWWVHLLWVAYMFLASVFWWWSEYLLRDIAVWTFGIYAFVLSYAFIIYLAAALLFPRDLDGYSSFENYFLSRRHWFFGVQILWATIDLVDSALKGRTHFNALGTEYWLAQIAFIAMASIGIWTARRWVQAAIATIYLAYQLSWAIRLFQTVS
ncbi:hypothetical protein ACUXST_002526 [Sphingomonas sp. F9_3S_D5_B_2]